MTGLAALLVAAAASFTLARWLRMPVIPLLLLVGIGLSLAGLKPPAEIARDALELGLTFLAFVSGVELSPQRLAGRHRAVLTIALTQFVVAGLAGYAVARGFGLGVAPSIYMGCTLCASSTLVGVRQLRSQKQALEPLGRLVIGVQLLQDFLMIAVLVVLGRWPAGAQAIVNDLAKAALLLVLAWTGQRWLMPWLIIRRQLDEELLLLVVLATLFVFVGVAFQFGLPIVAGALLAGLTLSPFPLNGLVRSQLASLSDFFVALFFIALAELVAVPSLTSLLLALALTATLLVLTPPLVAILAQRAGLNARSAIESGLLLAQASEFAIIAGLMGFHHGHLTNELFGVIVMVAALTMILTPFLATDRVTRLLLRLHPLRRGRHDMQATRRGHVLVLGFGAAGMWVVKPLRAEGLDVLVVDDDPSVIAQLQRAGIACLRGDGGDENILARAGAPQARLILASMRRVSDAEKVLHLVRHVPVVVRVFEQAEAERVKELGGIPILNSMSAADSFMEWFKTRPATTVSS